MGYVCSDYSEELHKPTQDELDDIFRSKNFRENVQGALDKAIRKYGSIIVESEFKADEEVNNYECETVNNHTTYKFVIKLLLSNGNKVEVYDGFDESLWQGNYADEDVIYNSLEKAIDDKLITAYEGIIHSDWDDGWRCDFIDSISISDIVDRLKGRKVRLSIIE